jgi:peroxiredoxin
MANLIHLKFNDPAPNLELLNVDGQPVKLSSLWKKKAVILAFARHFGCPQCKEMVETLVGIQGDIESNGLSLAIVTQGTPEAAKAFCLDHAPDVLCLADSERNAYRAYGLERANIWQAFLSPRIWLSNLSLRREKGWKTEWPPEGQDAMQLAGIFIIGPDGRIRLPYYYDNISDHPPIDLLLHGILGVKWKMPFVKPIAPSKKSIKAKSKSKK